MANNNHYAVNVTHAAADALNAGIDLATEASYTDGSLVNALGQNLTVVAAVDAAVTRVLTLRFRLGLFDPRDDQPYAQIPESAIGSAEHAALALDAALQGIVLLKNDNATLPLRRGANIAVVGPHAVSQKGLVESYGADGASVCRCGAHDDPLPRPLPAVVNASLRVPCRGVLPVERDGTAELLVPGHHRREHCVRECWRPYARRRWRRDQQQRHKWHGGRAGCGGVG
jgi:beta-glucosidase-like glycosyl hydrolase